MRRPVPGDSSAERALRLWSCIIWVTRRWDEGPRATNLSTRSLEKRACIEYQTHSRCASIALVDTHRGDGYSLGTRGTAAANLESAVEVE